MLKSIIVCAIKELCLPNNNNP